MNAKKIYIAGPMTGLPELNFPAFHAEARWLRSMGHEVLNPAELNGGNDELELVAAMSHGEQDAHWLACMRRDITALVTCDAIHLLPGWEKSRGAKLEFHIASQLGIEVRFAPMLVASSQLAELQE